MKLNRNDLTKKPWLDPLLLAFLIPFIGILAVMLIGGYEPFGNDRALLYSDEYHQYYPFFVAFRRALLSGEPLLYNWSVGMGMDYLGLISYYLGSPLNLLSVLVPESLTLEYFALLSPIKLGLAGLFFAIFLKKHFGINDHSISIFGGAYALCAWALGYQWNIMWLDTFALLPLVVLGTLQLLRDKKCTLYTISLFLSVVVNYYIGFFTCIFVLLIFIGYEICRFRSLKRLFQDFVRIGVFTVFALGMTTFLTLPALGALQNTQSSVNSFPDSFSLNIVSSSVYEAAKNAWETFKTMQEQDASFGALAGQWFRALFASFPPILEGMRQIAGNMGGSIAPTFKEGLPNVYCGVGSLLLGFLFLTSPDVKLRDKLCSVGLLVFFMLSFLLRQLDYIWHGFHFTNMIPYRFSFLFSFVLLYMAYRAWMLRHRFKLWQLLAATLMAVAILICSDKITEPLYLFFNLVFVILYPAVLLISIMYSRPASPQELPETDDSTTEANEPIEEVSTEGLTYSEDGLEAPVLEDPAPLEETAIDETIPSDVTLLPETDTTDDGPDRSEFIRRLSSIAFCVVMLMELVLNIVSFGARFSYTSVTNYPKGTVHTESLLNYLNEREEGSDFFRTETTHSQTLNDGALNGYYGISTFTSSANVRVTEFMKMLGYGAKNTYNRYAFEESSPVANLFLNLKYMIERDGQVKENAYFDEVYTFGTSTLLENNGYLPLGFLAQPGLKDSSLEQIDEFSGNNNFFRQNYLFEQATGIEDAAWTMLPGSRLKIVGSKSLELEKANNATGYTIFDTKDRAATLRYTYTLEESGFLCLDMNMTERNSYKVFLNDRELFSESMSLPQMISVCDVKPGDKIIIDITCKKESHGVVLIRAALLDEEVFRKGHEVLSTSTLDLTSFSTTRIEGQIDCHQDGLMYTSIPYDGNWIATVDGEEVEPVLVGDAMMALELTKGPHQITFRYRNQAFTLGLVISTACLTVFLGTVILPKLRKKKDSDPE